MAAYKSPLEGFQDLEPLPVSFNEDGRTLINPERSNLSEAYDRFTDPIDQGGSGFDIHVYYLQRNKKQTQYARELWERIRREFPELKVYRLWDGPAGPHPVGTFEVDVSTPAEFGAIVSWLAVWRGPLSVLVHPNSIVKDGESSGEVGLRDHTERAIWMGERYPVDGGFFTN